MWFSQGFLNWQSLRKLRSYNPASEFLMVFVTRRTSPIKYAWKPITYMLKMEYVGPCAAFSLSHGEEEFVKVYLIHLGHENFSDGIAIANTNFWGSHLVPILWKNFIKLLWLAVPKHGLPYHFCDAYKLSCNTSQLRSLESFWPFVPCCLCNWMTAASMWPPSIW